VLAFVGQLFFFFFVLLLLAGPYLISELREFYLPLLAMEVPSNLGNFLGDLAIPLEVFQGKVHDLVLSDHESVKELKELLLDRATVNVYNCFVYFFSIGFLLARVSEHGVSRFYYRPELAWGSVRRLFGGEEGAVVIALVRHSL